MNMTDNVSISLMTEAVSDVKHNRLSKDARLSHIKKEKSRDAARSRRGKENGQFYALATLLPIPEETSSQLDKASIIRLTMSYLQLQEFFTSTSLVKFQSKYKFPSLEFDGFDASKNLGMATQSLDGFLVIINSKGRCLFASESISEDLGLAQVDVIGSNILNFVHSSDHKEFYDHLNSQCCERSKKKFCQLVSVDEESCKIFCSFFIRMKSTQPRRSLGIKSSGYKVVHVTGTVVTKAVEKTPDEDLPSPHEREQPAEEETRIGFAGIARVLSHSPLEFAPADRVFVVKVDSSLEISFCEEQIKPHTNYEPAEVRGCTIYQFIHTADLAKIRTCHIEILNKGNMITPYYRWLLKNGTYIWVFSRCSMILEKHLNDEDHFLWITHVIARGQDDIPSNVNANPVKSNVTPNEILETSPEDSSLSKVLVKTEKTSEPSVHEFEAHTVKPKLISSAALNESKPSLSKLVKQNPEKPVNLKRMRSTNAAEHTNSTDETTCSKNPKVDLNEERIELTSLSAVTSCWSGATAGQAKSDDVLDVNSKMWGNPPNREVVNHSDLYTTVIHHHYPYGIDPNLLNSNPIFAKMLTTNFVTYESLFQRDAFILPSPTVNIFTPVIGAIPQLIPSQQTKLDYCPPSVASIIDELRKDPIREKNPPNKVVLSRSHIPNAESLLSPEASPMTVGNTANPPIFSFPSVSNMLPPLGDGLKTPGSNPAPIFIHPVKLAQNTINSLPI